MEGNEEGVKETKTVEGNEGTGTVDTQTTGKQNEGVETDVKAEAQKMADAMLAKKMKGMPSKEELKAFRDWQESQKTEEQKKQDEIIKNKQLQDENNFQSQMIEIMKKGLDYETAEFVQFKVSKMNGDFTENLENYIKEHPQTGKMEEKKNVTTGFSQNNNSKGVSEEKAYMDKKYANNPYYKK